jgi:LCP family protein required for cell wall assembly
MECAEARRLIDAGLRPGSTDPRRAALGFHLAGCAACRAYSKRPSPDQLLLALLEAPLPEPAAAPPAAAHAEAAPAAGPPPAGGAADTAPEQAAHTPRPRPAPPRVAAPRRGRPWLRYTVLGALALLIGALAVGVGQLAMAAYTIGGNIQAMQITAAPTLAAPTTVPTPAIVVPTAPPGPSTTPQPAAGVLDAAPAPPAVQPDVGAAEGVAPTATVPAAATAVPLPAIGGPAAPPTLMPTVDVLPAVANREPVTLLLLGSDRRPGESWQTRSDAIMVVRLDPARQRVALLALPRDLIVSIPGYGSARINAATVYGEMYPELGGGAELARQTVSGLLGIPVDHVLRADFSAFTQAVDAIGGVDIDVQQELYDPQYPTMDYGYMEAYFPVGPQHMDGATALIYSRMRHMDSNYARNRRQQEVLLAIMRRVREQNILGQAKMLADLSTALRDNVQTDLSLDQMIGLAWSFRGLAPEQVERYALDENLVYEGGIAGDPYATLPSPGAISTVVGQLLGQ